MVWMSEELRKI